MLVRWRPAVAVAALLLLPAITAQAAEAIKWQTSLAAAKAMAKKTHKLIFMDFYADW